MKMRKDLIIIVVFVFIFVSLSVIIFFFIREKKYEQVIDGGLTISEPISEYIETKQPGNIESTQKNAQPPLDPIRPTLAAIDGEKKKPDTKNTLGEAYPDNAFTDKKRRPVAKKNDVQKTIKNAPRLVSVKMTANPKINSAKNNAKILKNYIYFTLKSGDTLWDIAGNTGNKNPWRWTDILKLNRKKINYAYFNEDKNFWYIIADKGTKLKVPRKDLTVRAEKEDWNKYALQLAAYSEAEKKMAFDFVATLLEDGYFAYVYKTDRKIKSGNNKAQYYYRVRIGFFEDFGTASKYSDVIRERYQELSYHNRDFFIVRPAPKEFNGKLLDYGIQMLNPYVVEFIQNEDRKTALKFLKQIKSPKHHVYLVKQRVGDRKYSVKAGFFSSQEKAARFIDGLNKRYSNQFSDARITLLENIHEALAGQNVNFRYPGK